MYVRMRVDDINVTIRMQTLGQTLCKDRGGLRSDLTRSDKEQV